MRKLTAKKAQPIAKPLERGFILYEGASVLDGAPIVVVATLKTQNRKTGDPKNQSQIAVTVDLPKVRMFLLLRKLFPGMRLSRNPNP